MQCIYCLFSLFSQDWLPTVHDVLQADWQAERHSAQPTVFNSFALLLICLICFTKSPHSPRILVIVPTTSIKSNINSTIIAYSLTIFQIISYYNKNPIIILIIFEKFSCIL